VVKEVSDEEGREESLPYVGNYFAGVRGKSLGEEGAPHIVVGLTGDINTKGVKVRVGSLDHSSPGFLNKYNVSITGLE
jgi:hypothetical protein